MEIFSLLHWKMIAIEHRKEKPEATTIITEAEACLIDGFEGCTFNLKLNLNRNELMDRGQ